MKIVDAFIFYNEINMLTYRLNVLNDVVDLFVIVEANQTFTGKPKPLFFKENAHLYEKFAHKIVHHVVDLPFANPNPETKEQWENEWHQRNSIQDAIAPLDLEPNDILCVSDLDEITDPRLLAEIRSGSLPIRRTYKMNQETYYYNLNTKHTVDIFAAFLTTVWMYHQDRAILGLTTSGLRNEFSRNPTIWKAGWHLSFFGDVAFVQNKLRMYSHQEHLNDVDSVEERMKKCQEPFVRPECDSHFKLYRVETIDNKNLPPQYKKYLRAFYE